MEFFNLILEHAAVRPGKGRTWWLSCGRCSLASGQAGANEVPVHAGDHFQLDLFRTHSFAFADVGATAEEFLPSAWATIAMARCSRSGWPLRAADRGGQSWRR